MRGRYESIAGKRFGLLTVTDKNYRQKTLSKGKPITRVFWWCICDCGKQKFARTDWLKSGKVISCGCERKKRAAIGASKASSTHKMSGDIFYGRYSSIKSRCANKNDNGYNKYGGRGIKCLWSSFEEFRDDMYESYLKHVKEFGEKNTTIDRIDNDGNYCKENCRWASYKQQARNTRKTIFLTYKGKRKSLSDWADELSLTRNALYIRLHVFRWPLEKAFSTKLRIW